MVRILVTGASGFVGPWLLARLARDLPPDGRIVATGAEGTRPGLVPLDVRDAAAVNALVTELAPTAVVHLAALSQVADASRAPRPTWDVNLYGTLNLAQAVLRHAPGARFVFVGSSEVYGGTFRARSRPVDETALLDPANPYAASKAAADLLVGQMAREGLKAVRFRPFNHTGPGQSERFAVPAFAAQIARIEAGLQPQVVRVGNLDACRDFLDVRDVVEAYARSLAPDVAPPPGAVFNLASGVPRRMGDILESLLSRARVPIRVEQDPERMRASDTPLAVGDAGRAAAALGWVPAVPWAQTLGDVLDHQRRRAAGSPGPLM